MWETLHNEPLACIFWCCLIVFLATWAWAAVVYGALAEKRERETWEKALRWASMVLDPDWEPGGGHDDPTKRLEWARRCKVRARSIVRGEERYTL